MKRRIAAAAAVVAAGLLLPTTADAGKQTLSLNLCNPDTQSFSTTINNAYFPLPVGAEWVYGGTEQGTTRGLRIEVLDETRRMYRNKVTTRVVRETEWFDDDANGEFNGDEHYIEISWNYFAQTSAGTVCYFGEHVDIYGDNNDVVSHDGAWLADDPDEDFAPGIFMPKDPVAGQTFKQEGATGIAEDEATVIGRGGSMKVPAGTFTTTIKIRERNPLDGSTGFKYYAKNVGLIQDGPVQLVSYAGLS